MPRAPPWISSEASGEPSGEASAEPNADLGSARVLRRAAGQATDTPPGIWVQASVGSQLTFGITGH